MSHFQHFQISESLIRLPVKYEHSSELNKILNHAGDFLSFMAVKEAEIRFWPSEQKRFQSDSELGKVFRDLRRVLWDVNNDSETMFLFWMDFHTLNFDTEQISFSQMKYLTFWGPKTVKNHDNFGDLQKLWVWQTSFPCCHEVLKLWESVF